MYYNFHRQNITLADWGKPAQGDELYLSTTL